MRIHSATITSPRWWQWPTILSLDAPAVSVVWQHALARVAGVELRAPQIIVLAATVWLAYVADRWIEGWRVHWRDIRTERHHFYQRWRWPVALIWFLVWGVDVAVAIAQLSVRENLLGLLLMLPVLLYLLSHQLVHRHRRWRAPKELCVAALLTGGVVLFLPPDRIEMVAPSASLFALLCFANCALISGWERDVDLSHGQTSLAIDAHQHRWLFSQLPWLIVVLAIGACASGRGAARDVAVCTIVSACLLVAVDRIERRSGWRMARVLADVALLTPIAPWLWGR